MIEALLPVSNPSLSCGMLCAAAGGVLALSATFAGFVLYGFKRVQRLDKFEREMKR